MLNLIMQTAPTFGIAPDEALLPRSACFDGDGLRICRTAGGTRQLLDACADAIGGPLPRP